jgi:hypothetical protein
MREGELFAKELQKVQKDYNVVVNKDYFLAKQNQMAEAEQAQATKVADAGDQQPPVPATPAVA